MIGRPRNGRGTCAATSLWKRERFGKRLRRNAFGWRFRRQEPIGPYIVDFVCHSRWLVIEVDGDWHHWRRVDEERRLYLERLGYRVLRFSNAASEVRAGAGNSSHTRSPRGFHSR